ncbi:penicillin-binding protein [Enterococcus sp. LJL120]
MKSMKNRLKRFLDKRNLNPRNNRKKVGIILFTTSIGLFFLFAIRLSYIVVGGHVAGVSLASKTEELYKGSEVLEATRGTIYDRSGNTIAETSSSFKVYAILSETYVNGTDELYAHEADFNTIATILNQTIGIDTNEALELLQDAKDADRYQVEFGTLANNLSLETRQAIEAAMESAGINGLYFDASSDRIYPNGNFASYLIGYANSDDGTQLTGQMGIESAYNSLLAGQNGSVVYEKNNYGNPLPGTTAEETAAIDGSDIYTTIDSRLQSYLETLMDPVYSATNPENLTAILMKADTGEILAMSQRPSFDPENIGDVENWRNILVEDAYEPGSTIKVATVASAIDEGVFNENQTFQSGSIQIEDTKINDWSQGMGTLTMRQALSWSSNVGMVTLEQAMGGAAWRNHLEQMGIGESTYSGLNGESAGLMPTENIVDTAMSAYGQALTVTNLQMMKIFSGIANDGQMLEPHFISKVVNSDTGDTTVIEPTVAGQAFSANAANSVLNYMQDTVTSQNYGTAYGLYSLDGYNISAKTGTAQIGSTDGTGYLTGSSNYIYSVVLMYPSEDPEYVLYLTQKQPQNYDRTAFSQIANPLMKRSMDILSTETTSTETSNTTVTIDDYQDQAKADAAVSLSRAFVTPIVLGTGDTVTGQSVAAGETVDPNTRVMLLTDGNIAMPDTTDWTAAELEAFGNLIGVDVTINGEGRCVEQSVASNEIINTDSISFTLG